MTDRILDTFFLGRVSYAEGLRRQAAREEAIRAGEAGDALFLLEHEPVITLGRNARAEHVLLPEATLRERGIEVARTTRGGDVTFHGPGQLVGYPILDLAARGKDLGGYLRGLEAVLIRTLADLGVAGERVQGRTGVWVDGAKVAAIGIHVCRWVTTHGFALNVTTDLEGFGTIVPCGIRDAGVTSLERLLGAAPPLEAVARRFVRRFCDRFGYAPRWAALASTPS